MPFLNGILLATEENHTATVLWSWSALIRRCYMLPSLHRPDPFVSCCAPPALHCTFTCRSLCASCQRPILPILRHHPPCHPRPTLLSISTARYTPYLPTKQHHLHTHTHTHARKRSRPHLFLFPVPNYGKAKSALPSYHLSLSHTLPSGAAHSRPSSTRREKHQAEASAVQPFSA